MPRKKENTRLETFNKLIKAGKSSEKDITQEQLLKEKLKKLDEINAELKINDNSHEMLGDEKEDKEVKVQNKKSPERC